MTEQSNTNAMYISKGVIEPGSQGTALFINMRGEKRRLCGSHADYWLAGQLAPASITAPCAELDALTAAGLIEATDESDNLGRYRLLTRCIIVPAKQKALRQPLNNDERCVWSWISKAGLRLTVAELICLAQNRIIPTPGLLGAANRQNLVEAIYSADTIADNILENLMEHSAMRDVVVDAVFGLLRKRRIILI